MENNKRLTQEDEMFIGEFIIDVSEELQKTYGLDAKETDRLIQESVFLELIKEDPEYVVNHDISYWAQRIYGTRKHLYQIN